MMRYFKKAQKQILKSEYYFVIITLLVTFSLVILELILFFPSLKDDKDLVEKTISTSSIVLNVICILSTMISVISSLISLIKSKKELKQSDKRLSTTMDYLKMVNNGADKIYYEKILNELILKEKITKNEHEAFQKLYSFTYENNDDITHKEFVVAIDTAKIAFDRMSWEKENLENLSDFTFDQETISLPEIKEEEFISNCS